MTTDAKPKRRTKAQQRAETFEPILNAADLPRPRRRLQLTAYFEKIS